MKDTRTIKIHIKEAEIAEQITAILRSISHLRNMLIILIRIAQRKEKKLHSLLLKPDVLRAVLFNRHGGTKSKLVALCRTLLETPSIDQDLVENCLELAQSFDAKHIYKLSKTLSGEFKGFYTKTKQNEKANPPKTKKLRELNNASLPLDKERVYIKENYFFISIGRNLKIEIPIDPKIVDRIIGIENIINYRLCFDGRDVSINISYEKDILEEARHPDEKIAGIDLGVNQLCSILILDKSSPSLVISGEDFKGYNHNFNRNKAKLASKKDHITNQLAAIEHDVYEALEDGSDCPSELCEDVAHWHELRPQYENYKRLIDNLYSNRKNYFRTNFEKVARSILCELEKKAVTTLVLSRDILGAKNKSSMGKKTNQKFVYLPFAILVNALKLYGIEHGIEVIDKIDEAYSSKSNCLYGDVNLAQTLKGRDKTCPEVKKFRAIAFQGRRHKGAFFCRVTGKVWHADLNGALNHIWIFLGVMPKVNLIRDLSFKLESPRILKGKELFEWLDQPRAA